MTRYEVAGVADMLAATLLVPDVWRNHAAAAAPERRTYTQHGQELTFAGLSQDSTRNSMESG